MISGPLFEAVQQAKIFEDDKIFVDAVPNKELSQIEAAYTGQEDLEAFVKKHFTLPEPQSDKTTYKTMQAHIEHMWTVLRKTMKTCGTLIGLPHPDIVPGGRFRECYYWDSYFIAVGLMAAGKQERVREMAENFAYLIEQYGYVPNGNRTYYLSRSQQPYFARLLKLLGANEHFEALKKEYQFWMHGTREISSVKPRAHHVVLLDDDLILNRYYDTENTPRPESYNADKAVYERASDKDKPFVYRHIRAACESGWDFSARWLKDHTNLSTICTCDIIPVDLNCLLYEYEILLAEMCKSRGDLDQFLHYERAAEMRKRAIMRYCWNEEKGFFFDYSFIEKQQSEVWSLASLFPLFTKIASKSQADQVVSHLLHRFMMAGGLMTSTTRSSQQWDAPNGWAPLQWIAVQGLLNYNYRDLAREIAQDWVGMVQTIFKKSHKMLEKYNVIDGSETALAGEYMMQEGFGWTNGVTLAFQDLFNT